MSTIGSLMLALGQGGPSPYGDIQAQTATTRGRELGNETALLTLQDLKQKQASEALLMERIKNDPELAQRLFGTIASLPTTGGPPGGPMAPGGPPGGGAMTQGTFGPGGVGAPQMVPGGQDASRYANVPPTGGGPIPPNVMGQTMPQVTPPQGTPTLATLGPQGGMPGQMQGQPQAPQNPLLEMARRDPRAALMLQKQIESQQLQQITMQEKHLEIGVKVAEGIARQLQGVTDQETLDAARERVRMIHPQAAAQIPQFYNKEAIAALQQRGIAMADQAKNRHYEAQSRKLDVESSMLPKLYDRITQEDGAAPAGQPGGGAGTQAPASGAGGTQARTAPPEYESAITEANKLYPQVSTTRIKSIIAAESNFDAKAVSSAGAKGPMQLLDGTAKEMGVDDPFNVQQNVRGGTRYYAQMLTKYGGDERKALAAYNWGPGNLDKVGGDVSKAPPETQAYVNRVLGGSASAGGTTGTAQAPPTDPRIAQLDAKIAKRTQDSQVAALAGNESLSTRFNDDANRLKDERTRLLTESQRQQERREELPRKVAEQAALEPGALRKERAGAEVQREAKQYEPIGIQAADELDLPASTLWKDVPKDRKPIPRPEKGERDALSGLRASVAGVDSLLTKLDDPKIAGMIGTIFSAPPAAIERLLGEWLPTLGPEQRAFAATIAGEIMEIRHRLIGAGQTGIEVEALRPMMPSTADTDPVTVRAKLTALREGMLRRHNAKRDDLAGMGFRVPDKLAAPPSASGLTADQQRLLDKHTTR